MEDRAPGNVIDPDDWHVLVEESGNRTRGGDQQHFIPTAVLFRHRDLQRAHDLLSKFNDATAKTKDISWKRLDRHNERVRSSQLLAQTTGWLHACSVIHCHHARHPNSHNEPTRTYEDTLQWLLQRVGWLVSSAGGTAHVTFATITRYRRDQLEALYARTRAQFPGADSLHPEFRLEQASREPLLLIPDRIAGAVRAAVEPTDGVQEPRYLLEMRNLFYRICAHSPRELCGVSCVQSYGLKIWPSGEHRDLFTAAACGCLNAKRPAGRAGRNDAKVAGYAGGPGAQAAADGTCPGCSRLPQPTQTATLPTVRRTAVSATNPAPPPPKPRGTAVQPEDDRLVGTVATLLSRRGHHAAAQLLASASDVILAAVDQDWGREQVAITVVVPVAEYLTVNDEIVHLARDAWDEVFIPSNRDARHVSFAPQLLDDGHDWRGQVSTAARTATPQETQPAEDAPPF